MRERSRVSVMRDGRPDRTSIAPVTFSVASSRIRILFGHAPTYIVPLPPLILAGGAGAAANDTAPAAATRPAVMNRFSIALSREHEIELAPVLLGRGALRRPVGRVIELVGHVRRPEAADVAVEDVALDRLAQTGGAAGRIRLPAGREHQRAAKREVRLRRLLWRPLLQRDDVFFRRAIFTRRFRHAMGFAVDCLELGHGQ